MFQPRLDDPDETRLKAIRSLPRALVESVECRYAPAAVSSSTPASVAAAERGGESTAQQVMPPPPQVLPEPLGLAAAEALRDMVVLLRRPPPVGFLTTPLKPGRILTSTGNRELIPVSFNHPVWKTALSLITSLNGNTVRNFPTHGQLSAAQGSPTTVSA